MFPRDIVCLRNISVDTLHKGDTEDDDDDDDNNNNNNNNTHQNTHKRKTAIPRAGFEPAIPARKRPQTHA